MQGSKHDTNKQSATSSHAEMKRLKFTICYLMQDKGSEWEGGSEHLDGFRVKEIRILPKPHLSVIFSALHLSRKPFRQNIEEH